MAIFKPRPWNLGIGIGIGNGIGIGTDITNAIIFSSIMPIDHPALGVPEIRDGEDLWQWSRLEIRLNAFRRSTIPQKQFIIIITNLVVWSRRMRGPHPQSHVTVRYCGHVTNKKRYIYTFTTDPKLCRLVA